MSKLNNFLKRGFSGQREQKQPKEILRIMDIISGIHHKRHHVQFPKSFFIRLIESVGRNLEVEGFVEPSLPAPNPPAAARNPTCISIYIRHTLWLLAQHEISYPMRSNSIPRTQSCNTIKSNAPKFRTNKSNTEVKVLKRPKKTKLRYSSRALCVFGVVLW